MGVVGIGLEVRENYLLLPFNWFIGSVLGMMMTLGAAIGLSFILYKWLHVGGADIKAILCLSLLYASSPVFLVLVILYMCILAALAGLRWKNIPYIPPLTAGYLIVFLMFNFGGIIT